MTANKLHAVATAFLLGTAAVGVSMVLATAPAYAAVRAEVGTPLQAAQSLAAAGNYKAAMEKVNEAEAVKDKTPDETSIISQMKQYIGAKSGDVSIGGAAAAKTKMANDYNAKNYAGVIADADAIKKGGGSLDASTMTVVAQSYYLSGNKAGCIKYIKGNGLADEASLQLEMKCAYDSNDEANQRDALEQLVAHTGKADYWNQLLKLAEQAKGLTDPQSLQLTRLKYLTGTVVKDDYINLAQLDLQLGLPAEAATVLDKGAATGVANDDRVKKLLALSKQQAAQVASGLPAALAAANKDPNGDSLIKVCLQQYSAGQAKDAVATCKSGLAKNPKDKDSAVIALGLAQIAAGQSADAIKTLSANKGDGNGTVIAHMYALYAAHPAPSAPAAAPAKAAAAPAKK